MYKQKKNATNIDYENNYNQTRINHEEIDEHLEREGERERNQIKSNSNNMCVCVTISTVKPTFIKGNMFM